VCNSDHVCPPIREQDYTDDLADRFQTCDIAPHLFTISTHHSPPEHGGRLYSRPDIGVYTEVILYGVHDSDDYLALDPLLEDTGTYSVRPTHPFKSQTAASSPTHNHNLFGRFVMLASLITVRSVPVILGCQTRATTRGTPTSNSTCASRAQTLPFSRTHTHTHARIAPTRVRILFGR